MGPPLHPPPTSVIKASLAATQLHAAFCELKLLASSLYHTLTKDLLKTHRAFLMLLSTACKTLRIASWSISTRIFLFSLISMQVKNIFKKQVHQNSALTHFHHCNYRYMNKKTFPGVYFFSYWPFNQSSCELLSHYGHYSFHLNRQGTCLDSGRLSPLLIVTVTLDLLAAKSRWQPSHWQGQLMMTTNDLCLLTSYCSCSSIKTSASWRFQKYIWCRSLFSFNHLCITFF